MEPRLDQFLELSAALTGFGRIELLGTGVAQEYLRKLDETMPGVADELIVAWQPDMDDEAIESKILNGAKLGPAAQDLILLWYLGTWQGVYASADSYQAALQWAAAGAHPPGSSQEGFGSWSVLPQTQRRLL